MNEQQYRQALQTHDWFYQYSDDNRAYRAGKAQHEQLLMAQRQLDPLGSIWNEYAPRDCRIATR